jgi:hypothetical protein
MALSVQEISDRLEIEEVLVRYCYAIDQPTVTAPFSSAA